MRNSIWSNLISLVLLWCRTWNARVHRRAIFDTRHIIPFKNVADVRYQSWKAFPLHFENINHKPSAHTLAERLKILCKSWRGTCSFLSFAIFHGYRQCIVSQDDRHFHFVRIFNFFFRSSCSSIVLITKSSVTKRMLMVNEKASESWREIQKNKVVTTSN